MLTEGQIIAKAQRSGFLFIFFHRAVACQYTVEVHALVFYAGQHLEQVVRALVLAQTAQKQQVDRPLQKAAVLRRELAEQDAVGQCLAVGQPNDLFKHALPPAGERQHTVRTLQAVPQLFLPVGRQFLIIPHKVAAVDVQDHLFAMALCNFCVLHLALGTALDGHVDMYDVIPAHHKVEP